MYSILISHRQASKLPGFAHHPGHSMLSYPGGAGTWTSAERRLILPLEEQSRRFDIWQVNHRGYVTRETGLLQVLCRCNVNGDVGKIVSLTCNNQSLAYARLSTTDMTTSIGRLGTKVVVVPTLDMVIPVLDRDIQGRIDEIEASRRSFAHCLVVGPLVMHGYVCLMNQIFCNLPHKLCLSFPSLSPRGSQIPFFFLNAAMRPAVELSCLPALAPSSSPWMFFARALPSSTPH